MFKNIKSTMNGHRRLLPILFFFVTLSLASTAQAAHDNMINPFAGKDYPQNPREDYFVESGEMIFNFSSFSYMEDENYFLKLVVTVKKKEGGLYKDQLKFDIFTDPLFGESKLIQTREFNHPYENRFTFYSGMENSGRYKALITIPGMKGVAAEFPMTIGEQGNGPVYIGIFTIVFVLVLISFIFVAKRRGASQPKKHKRAPSPIASILLPVSFLCLSLSFSTIPTAQAYTHHKSLIKWNEYSSRAFELAKKENKPIFMLVTAIWCHWCHVYEEKTLEMQEIADYINKHYVPVFLDYDKRNDIAGRYQASGLPITVIMAPDGEELISAPGYIEKEQLLGNLERTVKYVKTDYTPLSQKQEVREMKASPVTEEGLRGLMNGFNTITEVTRDRNFGGFGAAAKKPFPAIWDYVLTYYEETKEKKWLDMALLTLDWMAGIEKKEYSHNRPDFKALQDLYKQTDSEEWIQKIHDLQENDPLTGLYDPVEGGFFRYSTKRDWSIPHYEKLLEDNADLIKLYLHAYSINGNEKYKETANGALKYVLETLYDAKDHRFYGSQDADEIYYHFTANERKKVKSPGIDKTSYARTNARMAISLFYAAKVLKDNKYSGIAENVLGFIKANLISDRGALSYYDPKKKKGVLDGLLEENSWVALAFLEAYAHTGNKERLETANGLIKFVFDKLNDTKNGGFYERNSSSGEFYKAGELFLKDKPYKLNGITSWMLVRHDQVVKKDTYAKEARRSLGLFIGSDEYTTSPYFQRVALHLLN